MKNVTITLDKEVARWARIQAAMNDTSVSRMVGDMLRQRMDAERGYDDAAAEFFDVVPRPLHDDDAPYPSRDELHDRSSLR
jgi:hypothetical protein